VAGCCAGAARAARGTVPEGRNGTPCDLEGYKGYKLTLLRVRGTGFAMLTTGAVKERSIL